VAQQQQDSAIQAGIAVTETESVKCQKGNDLFNNYCFQPVSIKTIVKFFVIYFHLCFFNLI